MLERRAAGKQIDGEDTKTERDGRAMALGNLAKGSCGHFTKLALLVGVDLRFRRGAVAGSAGFDLEKDQRIAIPGDKVEVTGEALRAPATGDDGVAQSAQVEEGF